MPRKIATGLVSCCCLILAQSSMAESGQPAKPAKLDEKSAPDPATTRLPAAPKPVNTIEQPKGSKPRASLVTALPVAVPEPDSGLGCAKND
jgi:hypothetical protein